MNKNAIQKFAIWARNELIAQVSQRAYQYGIEESGFGDASADTVGGRLLTAEEKSQRQELIRKITEKGYRQVMEEVAYTWFNRFIALRFMEVNGFLPSHIRVFSDASGAFQPEILNDALHLDLPGLDTGKVAAYLGRSDTESLYRYLLLTQCNALNEALPVMFERMGGYTEMLLPNNILKQDGVLGRMVSDIPEADWQDAVQIIGWLYQFYNTEPKAAAIGKKDRLTKEEVPAATQLFTPDWIVRYMVENSLGRLWLEGHPNAALRGGWKYYLDEAQQEPDVEAQLAKIREEYKTIRPEDIKVIDPCIGSGHILVYAFDVLMQIYTASGWEQREAAQSILKNNLFGLDIDDRAAQLAYFAVMMKARQYDRRLLGRGIQPNVYAIRESNGIQAMTIEYFYKNDPKLKADIERIVAEMRDAKEYGSILTITPVDFAGLYARFDEIREDINMMRQAALDELLPLVKCAELLAQKYDVVVTNPPYMAVSNAGVKVNDYVKKNFPDSKADLFSCFIEHGNQMIKRDGLNCMVTMQSWMFLSSFEKMREKVLQATTIKNLMHMENMVMGIAFGTAVTIFQNSHISGYKGTYNQIKLHDVENGAPKEFPVMKNRFAQVSTDNFSKIPGSPVAYWVSENFINAYQSKTIAEYGFARSGLQTGDNNRFLRFWQELSFSRIAFGMKSKNEYLLSRKKWTPQIKGGEYRKWYGNFDYVVNWENDGIEIRKCDGCRLNAMGNDDLFFRAGITWSHTTSSVYGARYLPGGCLFNVEAPTLFVNRENEYYILAFLNSCVAQLYLNAINSTIHYLVGNISALPVVYRDNSIIDSLVDANIKQSKEDWDSYETSWDFKRNPLV